MTLLLLSVYIEIIMHESVQTNLCFYYSHILIVYITFHPFNSKFTRNKEMIDVVKPNNYKFGSSINFLHKSYMQTIAI